jgi:hypothetical protein
VREKNRRRRRSRNSDVHAQPGIGGGAAQLFADRSRLADKAAKPADVERDRAVSMRLDTRRKIARNL